MCAHAFWRGYEETHPMGEIDMTGVPEELPEDPNEPEAFTNWRGLPATGSRHTEITPALRAR